MPHTVFALLAKTILPLETVWTSTEDRKTSLVRRSKISETPELAVAIPLEDTQVAAVRPSSAARPLAQLTASAVVLLQAFGWAPVATAADVEHEVLTMPATIQKEEAVVAPDAVPLGALTARTVEAAGIIRKRDGLALLVVLKVALVAIIEAAVRGIEGDRCLNTDVPAGVPEATQHHSSSHFSSSFAVGLKLRKARVVIVPNELWNCLPGTRIGCLPLVQLLREPKIAAGRKQRLPNQVN
jgi:hypothetical protein